jgi:predicted acyltransferase
MSIDALRGFDMFWIVGGIPLFLAFVKLFVNPLPAWLPKQFEHVLWNGFSPQDLIMPLFLFVVGSAMPFSFAKRIELGQSHRSIYLKIARRVLILWVLGMIHQGNLLKYDMSQLLLFSNTLQAIAVGYAIAAVVMLNLRLIWQAATIAILLVTYWALLNFVPVPGHGAVVLEPDAYVWILPSLGFTATVLLGVMSGHLLRSQWSAGRKVAVLLALGVGSLAAGALWGQWFPINKHMWTSPMVLWSGGWCFLLLAVFYLLIDVLKWRAWAFPFTVIGVNAITAYMLARIVDFKQFGMYLVGNLAPRIGVWGEFLQTFVSLAVLWLLLWYMRRNKTFIKI